MLCRLIAGVLIGVACVGPACASAFSEGLARADALRSSDVNAFRDAVQRLDSKRESASESELRQLALMHAYERHFAGQYQQAIDRAVALADQAPETELQYRASLLIATAGAAARDFALGLRYLERALESQPSVQDRQLRMHGLGTAAVLYNQYGHHALALDYADKLLSGMPEGRTECYARQVRAEALHGLKRPIDEPADIQAGIAGCLAVGETIGANLFRLTLAEIWAAAGKQQQAIHLLENALPEVERGGYSFLIKRFHSLLGQYKLDLGRSSAAEAHALVAIDKSSAHSNLQSTAAAYFVLYRVALQRNDPAGALRAYQQYAEADKARLDDVKAREYAFQISRHELAQKNQSIELLKQQNQLLRLQQEVARKDKSNSQLLIALLMVVASSLGYWGWRARRMHRTLRQLAQTDSLTGLANRRHFRAQTEALLADVRERGRPLSVLLFDLDHFKQINDQCGHAAGDWVLKEVARVGRLHCRPGDVLGRIGGEEFALTLVDCDLGDAELIAERMREAIAAIDGRANGCPLPVSASIGCVGTSVSGHEYETLVAHADAAMYRSKVGGRNRISRYQTASITPVPVRIEPVPVAPSEEALRAS